MGAAAYGGRGFRERASVSWERRRQLQTAIQPGVMPTTPPKKTV